jgi:3-methyladenine DNA glycosylase Mpg
MEVVTAFLGQVVSVRGRGERGGRTSPGKLCQSFQISRAQYGADLCGDELFLEDHGVRVAEQQIHTSERVGINKSRQGFDRPWRFFVRPSVMVGLLPRYHYR